MAGRRRSILGLCLLASGVAPLFSAVASENVAYTYDAQGRLTQVSRTGTVNNGINSCYRYDRAGNRENVTSATSDCRVGQFSVFSSSAVEGSGLILDVRRSGNLAQSASVNFATSNGTATAGVDYVATSGVLNFAAGETSKTVSISTVADSTIEADETVSITLSNPSGGAVIAVGTGFGTILNDDVSFAINSASGPEAAYGLLTFVVTKTGNSSLSFTVNYATADGTAKQPSDYLSNYGQLTFKPGDTTKEIPVWIANNSTKESTETFSVNLSNPSPGATITVSQGTGTIIDDD